MAAAKELSPEQMNELEKTFRAGLVSWRDMSKTFGVGMAWLKKTAERLGWQRDLAAKIQQGVKRLEQETIARESARPGKPGSAKLVLTEKEVTESNIAMIAKVSKAHRGSLAKARAMSEQLLEELEFSGTNRELLDAIANELYAGKDDRRAELIAKLSSTQGRTASFKQLVDSLKVIITTEREILRISDGEAKPDEGIRLVVVPAKAA